MMDCEELEHTLSLLSKISDGDLFCIYLQIIWDLQFFNASPNSLLEKTLVANKPSVICLLKSDDRIKFDILDGFESKSLVQRAEVSYATIATHHKEARQQGNYGRYRLV